MRNKEIQIMRKVEIALLSFPSISMVRVLVSYLSQFLFGPGSDKPTKLSVGNS